MIIWIIFLIGLAIFFSIHAVIRCLEQIISELEKIEKHRAKRANRKRGFLRYPARENFLNN